jgi:hypothetical protein
LSVFFKKNILFFMVTINKKTEWVADLCKSSLTELRTFTLIDRVEKQSAEYIWTLYSGKQLKFHTEK